jgi:outer membrane lipoprotein-sorting protein
MRYLLLLFLYIAAIPDADKLLRQTMQTYNEMGGLEATFSFNLKSPSGSTSFDGVIVFKEDKFFLTTPDMLVWFDGVTQWTYLPQNEEVNVSVPTGAELRTINPLLFLRGYDKDFKATYTGESTTAKARIAYDLKLTPRKKGDVKVIEVQIEKSTYLPARIVAVMNKDVRNTIVINDMKSAKPSDSLFVFPKNKYPEAEIIDLR